MQDPRHRDFVADDSKRLSSLACLARQKLLQVAEQAVRNVHGDKWPQLPNQRPCDGERATLDMLRQIANRAIPKISIHGDARENMTKVFRGDVRDAIRELDWSAFWTIIELHY